MKKILSFCCVVLLALQGQAQTPFIGHTTFTFNDSTRTGGYGSGGGTGRQIQCEVYYPSTSSAGGDNVAIASGQYPVLVFGHGFVMVWSAYDNLWSDLVPQGYVMAFLRTEGGTSPGHADFGKDMALVATKMVNEGNNPANILYQHVINKTAIMGHSMGGGASFLAAANNANITTLVNFAAANTNPSSIAGAQNVHVPTLVMSGANDCVAPPPANQDSMYIKTAASCKALVHIIGGAHCEFANFNSNCSFGQSTCSPQPTISGALEHSINSVYYSNWLAYWLKGDCNAWKTFNDSLLSNRVTSQKSCSQTCTTAGILSSHAKNQLRVYPNPAHDILTVELPAVNCMVEVVNLIGETMHVKTEKQEAGLRMNISSLAVGTYFIKVKNGSENYTAKFTKID